mgnify:CR=1 FL=1
MFEKSKWIWENAEPKPDEYAEFLVKLNKSNGKKYVLNISVDTNYSVSINGVVASFGQYSDYPTKKTCNSVDITDNLKNGENELQKITDEFVKKVDEIASAKEKEVMEI